MEMSKASKTIRPSKSKKQCKCEKVFSAEEGRAIKGQRYVVAPSREEYENHMRTHIPFRKWCQFCVMGKSKSMPHRKSEDGKREVPMMSYDYWVVPEGSQPVIVGIDHDPG